MVTKTSPIPRPLLVHWPAKPQYCQEHMPGYLAHVDVTPHFAQPNSVEFQPAVEWRHLDITWLGLKWRVHDMHADQLAQIMEVYVKVRLQQPSCIAGSNALVELAAKGLLHPAGGASPQIMSLLVMMYLHFTALAAHLPP